MTKRQGERLVGLLIIGLIAINYPVLSLFSKPVLWFGVPVLYLYLFVVWALIIGLASAVMGRRGQARSDAKRSEPEDAE